MAGRTATLDFRSTGADTSATNVVKLADALEKQRAKADALAQSLPKARKEIDGLSVTSRAAAEELARFTGAVGPLGVGLAHIASEAPRAAQGLLALAGAGERANLVSRTLNATLFTGGAVAATATVGLASYTRHLLEMADAYASLQAKVKIYTGGAVEAAQIQNSLFSTARDSRSSVESTSRLFQRLAPEIADSGRRPEDAVKVAGIVSKALAIQGASSQEQTYGVIDLIHALGSGELQGRQLRGLQTEAPVLLRYIAQNLQNDKGGFGVPIGDLAELAKEKKLSSEKVLDALFRSQPQVEADLAKAPKLASQAYQALSDSVLRTVGEVSQLTGAQPALVGFLGNLADRSDRFRESLERDPQALGNVRAGLNFIGQTVDELGHLGGEAFRHLDLIVRAAELIISLKVGEAVAGWFGVAARGAASTARDLQEFAAQARFNAGARIDPVGAQAAQELRAAATAADARAVQTAERAALAKSKAATAAELAEGKVAEAARLRAAAVEQADAAQRIADAAATQATLDRAAADRLAGEAAEIRARLEGDAAARSAEAAAAQSAAGGASALTGAGIGSAGAYYAKQAQADAVNAMRLTEAERAAQLAQIKAIEVEEAGYAATVTASEGRVAQAAQIAGAAKAEAATLAARADTQEAEAAAAAAAANDLKARAERTGATAAAANAAATAAAERAMVAETAVAAEATSAMVAQNVALGVLTGAYNLLGGGIGIAAIAIGGLIYAIWQEEQAFRQQAEALRASVVVSEQMRAVTDQLSTATWSQIPALRAQAQALRDVARARLEGTPPGGGPNLRQKLNDDEAALKRTTELLKSGSAGDGAAGLALQAGRQQRQIDADRAAISAGERDVEAQARNTQRADIIALTRTIQHNNDLLGRGETDRGDKLSGADREKGEATRSQQRVQAKGYYDQLDARYKQEEANQRARGVSGQPNYQRGLQAIGELRDLAAEAIHATDPLEKVNSSLAGKEKKPKARGDVDSALKRALQEIEQQQTYGEEVLSRLGGIDRFGVADGKVRDLTTGGEFKARSQDEAKAAQRFQDQMREVAKATPVEITKYGGGRSKDQLREASEEAFRLALAGSQAAKQDDALAQGLQRLGLAAQQQTTKVRELDELLARNPAAAAKLTASQLDELKAKAVAGDADAFADKLRKLGLAAEDPETKVAELNALIAQNGAAWSRLTPFQQDQLRTWALLADRVDAAKKALSAAKPFFDEAWRIAQDGTPRVTGFGLNSQQTATASLARLGEVNAAARRGFESAVNANAQRLSEENPARRAEYEKAAQDEIATYRLQSEGKIAEETAKISRASAEERIQREEQAAGRISDAFRDLVLNHTGAGDIGKRITDELLQAMYDNLVGNPLKGLIKQVIGDLFKPGQTGSLGGIGSLLGRVFGFGGADASSTASIALDLPPYREGGPLPGFASGMRSRNGRISGPGTDTSDSILALFGQHPVKLSDGEFVMNAAATKRWAPVLDAMNRGGLRGYADGGPVSPIGGGGLGGNLIVNDYRTNAPPVQQRQAPNGDQVIDIRDAFQKGIRGNPGAVRDAAMSASPRVTRRGA